MTSTSCPGKAASTNFAFIHWDKGLLVSQKTLWAFPSNTELCWDHLPPGVKGREEVILPLSLSYYALCSDPYWKLIKNIKTLYSVNEVSKREISTILITICCRRSNPSQFSKVCGSWLIILARLMEIQNCISFFVRWLLGLWLSQAVSGLYIGFFCQHVIKRKFEKN